MEHHTTLNDELNKSCKKSKLTSWTKHVNHRGTFYTIRFNDKEAILDPKGQGYPSNSTFIKYKPKSRFHINRDHFRMKNFKEHSLQESSSETGMFCDNSIAHGIHHSATVSSCLDQNMDNSHIK